MPLTPSRPALSKTLLQLELNRFYAKPVTRVATGLVLSIIAIAFFSVAAIKPTLETMTQLIKQIDEKKVIDQQLTVKINALTAGQKELAEKEEAAKIIDLAIPASPTFNEVLIVIEKLASEHSVFLTGLSTRTVPLERTIEESTAIGDLESFPITIGVNGMYENLSRFLRDLQNLRRIILVDRFDITKASEEVGDKDLVLTVSIRAFALKPKSTKTNIPTAPGSP